MLNRTNKVNVMAVDTFFFIWKIREIFIIPYHVFLFCLVKKIDTNCELLYFKYGTHFLSEK